jgi:hypothetical protein
VVHLRPEDARCSSWFEPPELAGLDIGRTAVIGGNEFEAMRRQVEAMFAGTAEPSPHAQLESRV